MKQPTVKIDKLCQHVWGPVEYGYSGLGGKVCRICKICGTAKIDWSKIVRL